MSDTFPIPNEIMEAGPEREAYERLRAAGYQGRFPINIPNIRKFKDNPYIRDLSDAERLNINNSLLVPTRNELFVDDDNHIWICRYEANQVTGSVEYKYYSSSKDVQNKLDFYETTGVLNQLMSAYNNGRVYNFYVDRLHNKLYPNSNLVFPPEYKMYRIRKIDKTNAGLPIFVAGVLEDTLLQGSYMNCSMIQTKDDILGTSYSRMGPAEIFNSTSIVNDGNTDVFSYDVIENGKQYVVEFMDAAGMILNAVLFQAIDASVENISIPERAIVDLRIEVLRQNIIQESAGNIYPIFPNETIMGNINFNIYAVYGNGDVKNINSLLGTGHLQMTGHEAMSANNAIGDQTKVTFTYYPYVDEIGNPITIEDAEHRVFGVLSKSVIFQVISNEEAQLFKMIPVMWRVSGSDAVPGSNRYRLKLFCLTKNGVMENRTKAMHDTMMMVDVTSETGKVVIPHENVYNPYEQAIEIVEGNTVGQNGNFIVSVFLYDQSKRSEFRFRINFTDETYTALIIPLTAETSYGYESDGALESLKDTCSVSVTPAIACYTRESEQNRRFVIKSPLTPFRTRYIRKIDERIHYPSTLQVFCCSDAVMTPLTDEVAIGSNDKEIVAYAIRENRTVNQVLETLTNADKLLVKFYENSNGEDGCVNFEVYSVAITN